MKWTKECPRAEGWYWVRGAYSNDVVFELYPHVDKDHLSFLDEVNSWEVGLNTDGLEFCRIQHPDEALPSETLDTGEGRG